MRDQLTGLLEKADLALGSAADVIAAETLAPLIESVRGVRTRLAYPDDVLVVALAGGTGSGKSSLFNALCAEELVDVGGVRPTTSHPAAATPRQVGSAMDGYLDRLEVTERHAHDGAMVCLLDLPDTDSVEIEHRYRVDSLLPLVDLVVWVVDPEKYRDSRLHDEYLKPLAGYSSQFVFVINQADRLSDDEADDVRADLEAALEEDSIETSSVILTAAAPPSGPPMGLDGLESELQRRRDDRATLYGKLLNDLAYACGELETSVGSGLDFDDRAARAVDEAARHLAAGDTAAATDTLTSLFETLEAESGGVTADKLATITGEVPAHVRRIAGELTPDSEERNWLQRLFGRDERPAAEDDAERKARHLLSEAVVRPARVVLARRAVAVASVADLAVEVQKLRAATPR